MKSIGEQNYTYSDVMAVAFGEKVEFTSSKKEKVTKAREAVENILKEKKVVYGITTGIGALKNKVISEDNVHILQKNLILSHAVGVGNFFPQTVVRGIIFLIANYLAKGHSGVRVKVIETLNEMLNKGVHPLVPEKGSVGSSGDLAPSAHVVLVIIGKGEATYQGKRMSGIEAMKAAGIKPLVLEAKEGLALINNTAVQTSVACHALYEANKLIETADISSALSVEAHRGTLDAFDSRIHELKAHTGQQLTAKNLRKLLDGSTMVDNSRTQDQYSIRCIPQIHGAIRIAINYTESVVNTEINAVTDNPLIFIDEKGTVDVLSGGNFHGEPIAIALDTLGIALSEIANVSDRRVASLLDPATNNGLPGSLIEDSGVNSGLMILQYTTAALTSENKILSHPASVDSIPTSANIEDLVSMGTISARKAYDIAMNVKKVLAIEIIVSCQAINFRNQKGLRLAPLTQQIFDLVRKEVPFFVKDELYYPHVENIIDLIDSGSFKFKSKTS